MISQRYSKNLISQTIYWIICDVLFDLCEFVTELAIVSNSQKNGVRALHRNIKFIIFVH